MVIQSLLIYFCGYSGQSSAAMKASGSQVRPVLQNIAHQRAQFRFACLPAHAFTVRLQLGPRPTL
jgi:hypothetical protein